MQATAKYFWVVHGAVPGADPARRASPRTTRSRARASTAFRSPSTCPTRVTRTWHTAARHALDRHRLARHGPVHRAGDLRARAEVPAARRQLPVRLPAGHRGRLVRRPVVGGDAEARASSYNFWFGHQGYEYIDLGRFWQIFLFVGLLLWLLLVGRALWPALQARGRHAARSSVLLFLSTDRDRPVLRRRADVGRAHAPRRWSSTGAGGWCTCGSKASSRCSPPRSSPSCSSSSAWCAPQTATDRRAVRHDRVPGGRHPRHLPPPVLLRHADGGARARRDRSPRSKWCRWCLIGFEAYETCKHSQRHAVDGSATAGRSTSSSRWRSGTWSAPACSAS